MRALSVLTTIALGIAACGTPSAAPSASSRAPIVTAPPSYLSTVLTDVRGGAQFSLKDLSGKTVIVEGMAVW